MSAREVAERNPQAVVDPVFRVSELQIRVRSALDTEAEPVLLVRSVESRGIDRVAGVVVPIERLDERIRRPREEVRISDEVDADEVCRIPSGRDIRSARVTGVLRVDREAIRAVQA